jgi:hypothetical protein
VLSIIAKAVVVVLTRKGNATEDFTKVCGSKGHKVAQGIVALGVAVAVSCRQSCS